MQKRTKISIIITVVTIIGELFVIIFGFGFFTDILVSSAIDDITKMTNVLGYGFSLIGYIILLVVSMLLVGVILTITWVTWLISNKKQNKVIEEKGV